MADEPTILEQLQIKFGSDLSGVDSYVDPLSGETGRGPGIKESLYIMNGVGTDKMLADLDPDNDRHLAERDRSGNGMAQRPSKGDEGTEGYVPAITVDGVIAGAQAPFDAMATLLVFLTGTVPDHSH